MMSGLSQLSVRGPGHSTQPEVEFLMKPKRALGKIWRENMITHFISWRSEFHRRHGRAPLKAFTVK